MGPGWLVVLFDEIGQLYDNLPLGRFESNHLGQENIVTKRQDVVDTADKRGRDIALCANIDAGAGVDTQVGTLQQKVLIRCQTTRT